MCPNCEGGDQSRLEPVLAASIYRCPGCATYFQDVLYDAGPEYMNMEEWVLRRLTPSSVLWHVSEKRLPREQVEKDLPRMLESLRLDLLHPELVRRRGALEDLLAYHAGGKRTLNSEAAESFCTALLDPPDEPTRLAVLALLPTFSPGYWRELAPAFEPRLRALAETASPAVGELAREKLRKQLGD